MTNGFNISNNVLIKYEGEEKDLIIPDDILEIGEEAFKDNKKITSIQMSDSVIKISSKAFNNCTKLKTISLSQNIEIIGNEAFAGCKALLDLNLPKTLKEVGRGAFAGLEKINKITSDTSEVTFKDSPFSLYGYKDTNIADEDGYVILGGTLFECVKNYKKLVIPEGVTRIHHAFYKGREYEFDEKFEVEEIVFPESLKYIGVNCFTNLKELNKVIMPSKVDISTNSFAGCLKLADEYNLFSRNGIAYVYFGEDKEVEIPKEIKVLNRNLFAYKEIEKVSLHEGLEVIGEKCFSYCDNLKEINIPSTVHTISDFVFEGCSCLNKVDIKHRVLNLGHGVFQGCRSLADESGFVIFNNCLEVYAGGQKEIIVNEGIERISDDAFNGLAITSIKLPESLKYLGSAFKGCDQITEIVIPEGIKEIKCNTFENCFKLTNITLPESLTKIGSSAFSNTNIEKINLPNNLEVIGEFAFSYNKNLKEITIPSKVKAIGYSCFSNCVSLRNVSLGDSLEIINNSAFSNCLSLKEIVLPESLKTIKDYAFSDCNKLCKVTFLNEETKFEFKFDSFNNCPNLFDESGFKIINNILYEYDSNNSSVIIPEGVKTIHTNTFREANEYDFWNTRSYRKQGSLKDITLPESLQCIEDNVFNSCGSLKEMSIPKNVTHIGEDAFFDLKSLKEIKVDPENKTFKVKDNILVNKEEDTIIYVPAYLNLKEYTVPSNIVTIKKHAFADCRDLKKVIIPTNVLNIEDEAFSAGYLMNRLKLNEVEVDVNALKGEVGKWIFDISLENHALVYPKLPINIIKDKDLKEALALGFILNSEKYDKDYSKAYKEYVKTHKTSLLKAAKKYDLKGIEEGYLKLEATEENVNMPQVYKPDLNLKNPNNLKKVEMLEECVLKGTVEDVASLMDKYQDFEFTARALGLAARFKGKSMVDTLIKHHADFAYDFNNSSLARKYCFKQSTYGGGAYITEYYLMVVQEALAKPSKYYNPYDYSPMYGVSTMVFDEDLKPLSLDKRIEVVKYLKDNNVKGVSFDEMLFWALLNLEFEFADVLIDMGIDLNQTPPSYYNANCPTYSELLSSGSQSVYWSNYINKLIELEENDVLKIIDRLIKLLAKANRKLLINQKLFDEIKWNDSSLSLVLNNADVSKINKKAALEKAVSNNSISILEIMVNSGWIDQAKKREDLIKFATVNNFNNALAWLIDFKNRSVDVEKELAKEEKKMLKELMEDPNSISALKKKWSYIKLEDGTLQITSYKGDEEEVLVPNSFGKEIVSSIGPYAFSPFKDRIKNNEARKNIKIVDIPSNIKEISEDAFSGCRSLVEIRLPESLEVIKKYAFLNCVSLKDLKLPVTSNVEKYVFSGCKNLADKKGLIIINDIVYGSYGVDKSQRSLNIPNNVIKIADYAFASEYHDSDIKGIKEIILPEGLKEIGEYAFYRADITSVTIPSTVKKISKEAFSFSKLEKIELLEGLETIEEEAFMNVYINELRFPKSLKRLAKAAFSTCNNLRDIFIPDTLVDIGEQVFEAGWISRDSAKYIHTPNGSKAEEVLKGRDNCIIVNDYKD